MARTSLEIPAALVEPLRDTAVLLYGATAEALHLSLRAHTQRGEPVEEVHEHRARLAELDALLERLGWQRRAHPDGPLEVTAPRDILHDSLYGALIDAGERLAAACDGAWRGEAGLDRVRDAATEVIALDRLLSALQEREG
jgi:hypothetical protein